MDLYQKPLYKTMDCVVFIFSIPICYMNEEVKTPLFINRLYQTETLDETLRIKFLDR